MVEQNHHFFIRALKKHEPIYFELGPFLTEAGYGEYQISESSDQSFLPERFVTLISFGNGQRFDLEQFAMKAINEWEKLSGKHKNQSLLKVPLKIKKPGTKEFYEEVIDLPNLRQNRR